MTRVDLVARIQASTGFTKKKSAEMLEQLISVMEDAFVAGESVRIAGFGTFNVRKKLARQGCSPRTGESITIMPRRVLTYKPSKILKDAMNGTHQQE